MLRKHLDFQGRMVHFFCIFPQASEPSTNLDLFKLVCCGRNYISKEVAPVLYINKEIKKPEL